MKSLRSTQAFVVDFIKEPYQFFWETPSDKLEAVYTNGSFKVKGKSPLLMTLLADENIDNFTTTNVILVDTVFKCQAQLFALLSEYFCSLSIRTPSTNGGQLIEYAPETSLAVEDIAVEAFKACFDWIYLEFIDDFDKQEIMNLIAGAEYLKINLLKDECFEFLRNAFIADDVAFILYAKAMSINLKIPELNELLLKKVCRFFLWAVASAEFLKMPIEDIITLCSSNRVAVNTEMEIFLSCMRWLDFDWENRKEFAKELMEVVHLDSLPSTFLSQLCNYQVSSPTLKALAGIPSIKDKFTDNMILALSNEVLAKPNTFQRNWFYDKNCSYHRPTTDVAYLGDDEINLRVFGKYLKFLADGGRDYWIQLKDRAFLKALR